MYRQMQAQAMLHAMIGGRATVERNASGKILARLKLDGRPLLGAAHPSLSNLVAGACYRSRQFRWAEHILRWFQPLSALARSYAIRMQVGARMGRCVLRTIKSGRRRHHRDAPHIGRCCAEPDANACAPRDHDARDGRATHPM